MRATHKVFVVFFNLFFLFFFEWSWELKVVSLSGLVLDGSTFFGLVASSLDNRTAPELEARIRALQWTQRVHTVAWNLPPLRSSYYLNTDLTEIENRVAGFLSSLLFRVSWSDMDTSLPVLQAVKG
jgi:hypothetical protein